MWEMWGRWVGGEEGVGSTVCLSVCLPVCPSVCAPPRALFCIAHTRPTPHPNAAALGVYQAVAMGGGAMGGALISSWQVGRLSRAMIDPLIDPSPDRLTDRPYKA
jgi:hypothetical protein